MPREAPRTLHTLAVPYQRDIATDDYEVLVVDNGSRHRLDATLPTNFAYRYVPTTSPSPVVAVNTALADARGDVIGLLIDGARMASPRLLASAMEAMADGPDTVVATLSWHLGPDVQSQSILRGYDAAAEDQLLAGVDWQRDGYEVFRIAAFAESSAAGWYRPLAESNALFLSRSAWEALGGLDPRFDGPGGGFVNLDLLRRAFERSEATPVVLRGEGRRAWSCGGFRGPGGPLGGLDRSKRSAQHGKYGGQEVGGSRRVSVLLLRDERTLRCSLVGEAAARLYGSVVE